MDYKLPPKFERDTRWLYVKAGVEYGPFLASDILKVMDAHTIDGESILCELGTGQRCALREVKPFAEYLTIVARQDEMKKADAEFEATTKRMRKSKLPLILSLALGVPVLVGGLIAYILWPKTPPVTVAPPGMEATVQSAADPALVKPKTGLTGPLMADEADVVERRVQPTGEELDDYLKQKLKKEEQLASAGEVDLAKRNKVVEETDPKQVKKKGRKGQKGGAQASDQGAADESVLDFSQEGSDPDFEKRSSKEIVQKRFSKAVRSCGQSAMQAASTPGPVTVSASVLLKPDGGVSELEVRLDPGGPAADIRMCLNSEMPNFRVPPYEGTEEKVYASATFQ